MARPALPRRITRLQYQAVTAPMVSGGDLRLPRVQPPIIHRRPPALGIYPMLAVGPVETPAPPPAPDLLAITLADPRPRLRLRPGSMPPWAGPIRLADVTDALPPFSRESWGFGLPPDRVGVWQYVGYAAPLKPLTDPVSPVFPFSLYPEIVQPVRRRPVPPVGWIAWPPRLADVTATAPALSWQPEAPDWLRRAARPALGWVAESRAAVIPFLDPSRFGWRGVGADWLIRRRALATPAGLLETPVQYPIPEVSWLGLRADWIAQAGRVRGLPVTVMEPFDRPNPPSPELAWRGEQPDQVRAAQRVIDRLWHVQAPRMTPFVPDLVGGLAVGLDWVAWRRLAAGHAPVTTMRQEIVIPDLRRDWAPSYPDQIARRARTSDPATIPIAEGNRAVSPLDWYTNEQDRRPWQTPRPVAASVALTLPGGALTTIGEVRSWAWVDVWGWTGRRSAPTGHAILLVPPALVAAPIGCVEITPLAVSSPALLDGVVTTPGLIDGARQDPTVSQGEVC